MTGICTSIIPIQSKDHSISRTGPGLEPQMRALVRAKEALMERTVSQSSLIPHVFLVALAGFLLLTKPVFGSESCDTLESCQIPEARQFDFWVGEWSVNNRFLQADGSYKDTSRSRAIITPILGGCAIMEQWIGIDGNTVNGFSVRAFDPVAKEWKLVLNWPGGGPQSFGILTGKFRHGRGEFFSRGTNAQGKETITMYSFSDGLPNSVRWDSGHSTDGGQTYRTNWIMEFSRTRDASLVTEDEIFTSKKGKNRYRKASDRKLDVLLGDWEGRGEVVSEKGSGRTTGETRRTKIIFGSMVVSVLNTTGPDGIDYRRFIVFSNVPGKKRWEAWLLDGETHQFLNGVGTMSDEEIVFDWKDGKGTLVSRMTWSDLEDTSYSFIEERTKNAGKGWSLRRKSEWTRIDE